MKSGELSGEAICSTAAPALLPTRREKFRRKKCELDSFTKYGLHVGTSPVSGTVLLSVSLRGQRGDFTVYWVTRVDAASWLLPPDAPDMSKQCYSRVVD